MTRPSPTQPPEPPSQQPATMLAAWLPSSYYAFYVAALAAAVRLAVVLSLLVSADRVLNVLKFGAIRARAALTGRTPKDSWFCAPLPADAEEHPRVSERLRCAALVRGYVTGAE